MSARPLRAIIFDMDGTMTKPQNYMFAEMRAALNITKKEDILQSIEDLPASQQEEAHEKIRRIERHAMLKMEPQPGLETLMAYITNSKTLQRGICTRNFKDPVDYMLKTFLRDHPMTCVVSREFTPPKPSPVPLLHICKAMKVDPEECIMVGDGADDIVAAQRAGMDTVLLRNQENIELVESHSPTFVVDDLVDIIDIIRKRC